MGHTSAESDLEELLAESPADAARRAADSFSLADGDALALYGAGTLGRTTLAGLRAAGVGPVAFADDTPEKRGQMVDGLPVMPPAEIIKRFGARAVFAVTILNPRLSFLEARRRLESHGAERVVSFLSLAWKYPQSLLPHYQYELPQALLLKARGLREAFGVWADDESRRQFVAHLRFRLRADYDALPARSRDIYFPADVPLALGDGATFVDCGAYDGDTLREFLKHVGGRFRAAHAFEPDAENCQKLRAYVSTLDDDVARKVHVHHAGVGARRAVMSFDATGNTGASLAPGGAASVEVVPVDEIVTSNGAPVYVKYDVEGAEGDALRGTEKLIARSRPALAVSVYHLPDDFWRLPLYLRSLPARYSLFLRTHGEDGMDLICYAIPAGAGASS
jgi:FkbM family methyltransferase